MTNEPNGENQPEINEIDKRQAVYARFAMIWLMLFIAGIILFYLSHTMGWCN